jgi:hypothetical protein
MPEQNSQLSCRRDGGEVLLPRACSECEDKNRAASPNSALRPGRCDQNAARAPAILLGDPPVVSARRSGLSHARVSARWPVIRRLLFHWPCARILCSTVRMGLRGTHY